MVDPNRKINRLSDDDAAFLVECEQEFRNRYTDADDEFAKFVAKPTKPPPIVEPWKSNQRHHGGDSGNNWNRNNYRPNNKNHHYNRNNDNRSPRNYRQHYNRPYDRNFRREGDNSHGHGSSYQNY